MVIITSNPHKSVVHHDDALKSRYAACRSRTKACPSGLWLPASDGELKVSGSTVLRSHPLESTLALIRLYALSAAETCPVSPVRVAIRYVTAARSAVDEVSANELLSSM